MQKIYDVIAKPSRKAVTLFFVLFLSLYIQYLWWAYKVENFSQVAISILFGVAVLSLLKEKYPRLQFSGNLLAYGISFILIVFFFWYGINSREGAYLRGLPLISGVATALIASGFVGVKQYIQELILLFFLGVPSILSKLYIDISPLTAKATGLLLLYSAFDVRQEGVKVLLPKGGIEVVYDCSGIDQINYLLGLSILCLIMFPLQGKIKQLLIPGIAVLIGFWVNVARVAMMAIFANSNNNSFNYWHTGEGSYFFALIAVFSLGILYKLLLSQEEHKQEKELSQNT